MNCELELKAMKALASELNNENRDLKNLLYHLSDSSNSVLITRSAFRWTTGGEVISHAYESMSPEILAKGNIGGIDFVYSHVEPFAVVRVKEAQQPDKD